MSVSFIQLTSSASDGAVIFQAGKDIDSINWNPTGGSAPTALVDAWTSWVDRAARVWLESGDLLKIIIEFYKPGASVASARWDFPIRYDGNGVDEMWVDREFLQGSFAKATPPPSGCIYRVLLLPRLGAQSVHGVVDVDLLSLNGLAAREAGTVIATPDIMASMVYYK